MKETPVPNPNRDPHSDSSDGIGASSSGPDKPLGSSTPEPQAPPKQQGATLFPVQLRTEPAPDMSGREFDIEPVVMPKPSLPLAWLGIVAGPGAIRGHTFVLRQDNFIGRSKGDILLAGDATISSRHAQIKLEPSHAGAQRRVYVLYDLNSTNGTHVGALETVSNQANRIQRHELHDGDYILLGKTLLVFLQT
jgi:hypothetical protein